MHTAPLTADDTGKGTGTQRGTKNGYPAGSSVICSKDRREHVKACCRRPKPGGVKSKGGGAENRYAMTNAGGFRGKGGGLSRT